MTILIEGYSVSDLMQMPLDELEAMAIIDRPLVISIGSAKVLGQFAKTEDTLVVELAQIDGGGEGVLPAIARLSRHFAKSKGLSGIECIVHAINCTDPNLKLRGHLERTGFEIRDIPEKGQAFYKRIDL